ncbi:hypothetical protein PV382_13150, partial [Streptomyces scabiei]|nr:hypothetical protein [Streptomyces scabiei]
PRPQPRRTAPSRVRCWSAAVKRRATVRRTRAMARVLRTVARRFTAADQHRTRLGAVRRG